MRHPGERLPKLAKSAAGHHRDRHHGRVLEKRPLDELAHVSPHEFQHLIVHEVGFAQRDQADRHPQQAANRKVFPGLGHHRFVACDDEHGAIDAADPGQHVSDETLVAWHVHECHVHAGDFSVRKSQINRDSALLLFLEAIRVRAGQRLDQRTLPVIDMTGGADDDAWPCRRIAHGSESQVPATPETLASTAGLPLLTLAPASMSLARAELGRAAGSTPASVFL